ncbi:MAG TPA: protein kinase, partial [Micrococcaceae bacterium]
MDIFLDDDDDDADSGGGVDDGDDPVRRSAPDLLDGNGGAPTAPAVPGFQLERLLGAGASAQVWLVQDEGTGALLAAKCFPPSFPPIGTGTARAGAARRRDGDGRAGVGPDGGGLVWPSTSGSRGTSGRGTGGRGTGSRAAKRAGGSTAPERAGGNTAAMMERELRILGNYGHEHLVQLHSAVELRGPWDGGWALLMDYAPGGSVAAVVAARGRLSVGETVTVLTPLAQVLGYLHDQGVVHGDLSPGNVLFTAEGKPLLSDLGVGRMVGEAAGPRAGTPGFAAPGKAESGLLLDAAADVYALAALGWFCLTGDPPAETPYRMPLSAYLPDVPPELAAALEAGLQESARQCPAVLELGQAIY